MIVLKTQREIELIRSNGAIVADVLKLMSEKITPGIKTIQLDRLAEKLIRSKSAYPAFKGYRGYPASICVSIDNEIVHGIPGERVIKEGELVSIDIGVLKDGYYADAAYTFAAGTISPEKEKLVLTTKKALEAGIALVKVGNRLGDVSSAIQSCAEAEGFSVVRDLVGHGVGTKMHEEPQVPNFGSPGQGIILKEGMVLAIEPMVNTGGFEIKTLEDNWTVVTADGSVSAHFEHTVAVRKDGPDILTSFNYYG
ncbi:MAG: type I methionyl aminopeptidase [candidate division Zixibacteria bacterium]|nr:type I methionyl aminopeptidase [candidate division Zixibacteria bacterium]